MICNVTACTENYKAHLRSIDHLDVDAFKIKGV